ncbi:MAG: hypothetical protein JXR88_00220 [Clostridia bacterium]|nr:hypothetical protein [Clostridia bacterium]
MNRFFKELNLSIPFQATYIAWTDYRNQITDLITNALEANQKILIIGAGNGLDLDYQRLKKYQVTLVDVDESSINKGMAFQNVLFDYIIEDVTGLPSEFYKALEKNPNLYPQIFNTYTLAYEFNHEDEYDAIIILPIYTQLLIPLFYQLEKHAEIHELMTFVGQRIQLFHRKLKALLKDNGTIIVFSDILEYDFTDKTALLLIDQQQDQNFLKEHVYQYIRGYGHGLGSYGLYDLREEMNSMNEHYLLWPFDTNRLMLVQHESFKKK